MPEKTITTPDGTEWEPEMPPPEGGEAPLEPEPPKRAPAKPSKEERAEQKELERLREENRLLQQSERFWQQRAAGRKDGDEEPPEETPEEDLDISDLVVENEDGKEPDTEQTPDEFIDELSKLGPKALQKVVARMGYVNKEDVAKLAKDIAQRVVNRERGRMTSDAELISRFPDLRDAKSELYEETSKRFRAAVARDPKAKNSPVTLFLAAEAAELALGQGRRKPRDEGYDDYREGREEEYERRRRVEAQQGDRGRGGRSGDYGDDDDLGPEARQIVSAFGVDEKAYRTERAKERKRR